MIDKISTLSLIFTLVGVGIYFFSFIYYSFLLIASEKIVRRTKTAYLEAILRQESAWFDVNNPSELSSRIGKEVLTIQKAIGEKMGQIFFGFAMMVSGLTFAFVKGWSFSFVILASFPCIVFATALLNKVMQKGFRENMKAYGQSAGYAEQALNAIKVVVAFGQEEREVRNYQRFLDRARKSGVKNHCKGAIVMAFFFAAIFATYAWSFFMGAVWIFN
jgi:ABC-type multidrug transport system fused ATPase/permease subunit